MNLPQKRLSILRVYFRYECMKNYLNLAQAVLWAPLPIKHCNWTIFHDSLTVIDFRSKKVKTISHSWHSSAILKDESDFLPYQLSGNFGVTNFTLFFLQIQVGISWSSYALYSLPSLRRRLCNIKCRYFYYYVSRFLACLWVRHVHCSIWASSGNSTWWFFRIGIESSKVSFNS